MFEHLDNVGGDRVHEHEWADVTQVADPAQVQVCYCGQWQHAAGDSGIDVYDAVHGDDVADEVLTDG